jgi:hypothetical protein
MSAVPRYRPLVSRSRRRRNDRNAAETVSSVCGHHRPDTLHCCRPSSLAESQQGVGSASLPHSNAAVRLRRSRQDRARKAVTYPTHPANGRFQGGPVGRREIRHRLLSEVAVGRHARVERPQPVFCRHSARARERQHLAGTTRSRRSPTAAVGRPGNHAEGPLPGLAANSQSRPSADVRVARSEGRTRLTVDVRVWPAECQWLPKAAGESFQRAAEVRT